MVTTVALYHQAEYEEGAVSTSHFATDCGLMQTENFTMPEDDMDIISEDMEHLIYRVKASVCIPILFIVGFPANCINMAIFVKQGLKERINLCLFSLSFADFLLIIFVFIFNADMLHTSFWSKERFGIMFRLLVDNNVTGLYGFVHGNMVLSAIIACERCFCIVFPLHSQHFVKSRTMLFIIVFCAGSVSGFRFFATAKYRSVCLFDSATGQRTYAIGISEFYLANKRFIDILDSSVFGLGISLGCPVTVIIATIITSVKLRQTVSWRKDALSVVSKKEIAVTKMLVYLSMQFIVLSFPIMCVAVSPFFVPDLNGAGRYRNTFNVLLNLVEVFAYANSSLNFMVFFFTGSKYRQTFKTLCSERKIKRLTSVSPNDRI